MNKMYMEAYEMTLKVDFLENSEEIFLYVGALYSAMMWGNGIDEKTSKFHTVKPCLTHC